MKEVIIGPKLQILSPSCHLTSATFVSRAFQVTAAARASSKSSQFQLMIATTQFTLVSSQSLNAFTQTTGKQGNIQIIKVFHINSYRRLVILEISTTLELNTMVFHYVSKFFPSVFGLYPWSFFHCPFCWFLVWALVPCHTLSINPIFTHKSTDPHDCVFLLLKSL